MHFLEEVAVLPLFKFINKFINLLISYTVPDGNLV